MANIRSQKHDGRGRGWSLATEVDPRRIVRASFFIILFWLLSAGSPKAVPVSEENVEYPVKLAFLYNFTKFIEWPPESYSAPGAPMVICIVGDDPFDPGLEAELRARTAGSHSVQIRTLKPNDTLSVCPGHGGKPSHSGLEGIEGIKHADGGRNRGIYQARRNHRLDGRGTQSSF
jgi:hypothetical protein